MIDQLREYGLAPRIPDTAQFARDHQVFLLEHAVTGTPIDLSLAWLPFEHDALTRAALVDFHGVQIPLATPEDLIIQKAVAFRSRDRDDIERLLIVHGDAIDLVRVRTIVADFADILDDPQRLEQFEELIRRSGA